MRQRIRRTRLSASAKIRCALTLCLYILSNSFPLIYLPTVWKNKQFVTGLNQCLKSEMLLLELKGKKLNAHKDFSNLPDFGKSFDYAPLFYFKVHQTVKLVQQVQRKTN